MRYNTLTLPNGLRVIHLPSPSPIVYLGFQIDAGASRESDDEEGLAHFCEHTTFKGTERRRPLQIINTLESVGGALNAYTNKEETVYYAAIPNDYVGRAVDLLSDIVFHSVYPQNELDKEKEVIADEIESYNDSPSELIYDDFENILFRGLPLGHNILGKAERLRRYTTEDALRFTRRFYRPDNAVFFASGDTDFKTLVRLLRKGTPEGDAGGMRLGSVVKAYHDDVPRERLIIRDRQTHQAHVMMGGRAYGIHDERRVTLYLLNNILGGPGMNSRLNIVLRERHALVYTVESVMLSYADTGVWSVYFGSDAKDIRHCLRLIRGEMARLAARPLTKAQLAKAARQMKGQIGIASDNRETFALDFGKIYLHYGWERHLKDLFALVDRVTPGMIQQVAREIFNPERLTTLIYK